MDLYKIWNANETWMIVVSKPSTTTTTTAAATTTACCIPFCPEMYQ